MTTQQPSLRQRALIVFFAGIVALTLGACSTTGSGGLNARIPIEQVVEELRREARSGVHPGWRSVKEILPMRRGREDYIVFRVEGARESYSNEFPAFKHGYRIEIEFLGTPFKLNN